MRSSLCLPAAAFGCVVPPHPYRNDGVGSPTGNPGSAGAIERCTGGHGGGVYRYPILRNTSGVVQASCRRRVNAGFQTATIPSYGWLDVVVMLSANCRNRLLSAVAVPNEVLQAVRDAP